MNLKINSHLQNIQKEAPGAWEGPRNHFPLEQQGVFRLMEGKAFPVQKVPQGDSKTPGKLTLAAKKISKIVSNVWHFPLTQRVAKGLAKAAIDLAEGYAIEKVRGQIGEAILPGGVPAMEVALIAITGTSKALTESIQK